MTCVLLDASDLECLNVGRGDVHRPVSVHRACTPEAARWAMRARQKEALRRRRACGNNNRIALPTFLPTQTDMR